MDKLFLLKPGFLDPEFPGREFYCWHCALLEGVLAMYPQLEQQLTVVRVNWPKPRQEVIAVAGEAHQTLPLLVRADGRLIEDKDAILEHLSKNYGLPEPHP